jgi:hypothetical protein
MPKLRQTADNPVIAMAVSDIHFSHLPPVCRREEPDWYAAMEAKWSQLGILWREAGRPPVLLGGDIFDKWNPPYELTLWAAMLLRRYLPHATILAIPGQHDLPNQRLDQKHRSAYAVLQAIGCFIDLSTTTGSENHYVQHADKIIYVAGFPWGVEPQPREEVDADVKIAIAHRYAWDTRDNAFDQAGDEGDITRHDFKGYDFVHYGDNHIRWWGGTRCNPGSFYRRFTGDQDLQTGGFYLYADGVTIKPFQFDDTGDVFHANEQPVGDGAAPAMDVDAIVSRLERMTQNTLDVKTFVRQTVAASQLPQGVASKILSTLPD